MYSYKLNVMIVWIELWNVHHPAIRAYREDSAQSSTEQTQPNPSGFGRTVGTTILFNTLGWSSFLQLPWPSWATRRRGCWVGHLQRQL